jgi:hypothetical protein
MTLFDILKFNRELIQRISHSGYKNGDYKYVELYGEFLQLKQQGHKISYIVSSLSEKHCVSERKVYSIIQRFKKDCTDHAVG